MRRTNRTIALALSASLATLPLAGCGAPAKQEDQAPKQTIANLTTAEQEAAQKGEAPAPASESKETTAGGWTATEEGTGSLSEDERTMFNEAAQTSSYSLEPVQLIATQVVSGKNFAFLCHMTSPTTGASAWGVAVVYQDLEGNVRMSQVIPIDVSNIKTAQTSVAQDVTGGWEIEVPAQANALPSDDAQAIATALEEYKDVALTPIALLGTQVVAGANYKVLCVGHSASDESTYNLYVAQIYRDPEGAAQVSEVATLDLLRYVSS